MHNEMMMRNQKQKLSQLKVKYKNVLVSIKLKKKCWNENDKYPITSGINILYYFTGAYIEIEDQTS